MRSYWAAERLQRIVDRDQVLGTVARDREVLIKGDPLERAAALLVVARPREVDEHSAHQPGGHGKEVGTVLPLYAPDIDQPDVNLVHERRGLEHVVRTFAGHVPLCDALQLAVHEREQFLDGALTNRRPAIR